MFTLLTVDPAATVDLTGIIKQLIVLVSSIMVGTQTLTAALRGLFNIQEGKTAHILNWVLGVLAGAGFVAFNGVTFGLPVWANYVLGVLAGLIAAAAGNGFYDWEAIKKLFNAITDLFGQVHGADYVRMADRKKAEE